MNPKTELEMPFLRWAGGKIRSVERILLHLPAGKRLIEPFVGAGAVFLNAPFSRFLLGDINEDLIRLYKRVQTEGEKFIRYCEQFFSPESNCAEVYYHNRETFNNSEDNKLRAALFIYFNRHGFNGLCRYNSSGKFNVPFGQTKAPRLFSERMYKFHEYTQKATFECVDFKAIMSKAKKGDVVYCDPPYVPLTQTANFTCYSGGLFTEEMQIALAEQARGLAQRGIPVLLSNHDVPFTRELYQGATITSFNVRRHISRDGNNRAIVKELLALFS